MMNRLAIILSLLCLPACAQTYNQMQWGRQATSPFQFGANIGGTWFPLGTVNSSGVWAISSSKISGLGTAATANVGVSGANVPLLNGANTWSQTQTFAGASFSAPDANWTTGTNTYHYNGLPISIASGIPDSAKFGYGYGSIVEGISASVEVPTGSNALHTAAIAGYMRTRGAPSGVGLFGACLQSANATNGCWGFNTVTTNGPTVQPVTETGYDFGFLGTELDINLMKKAGGAAPTGNVIGLYLIGASEVQPVGSSDAIRVSQLGIGADIKWNTSLLMTDGASNYGIWRGTADKSVNNIGSISDAYVSRNSGGSTLISYINSNSSGDLYLNPASLHVLVNGGIDLKHQYAITFPDAGGAIPGLNGGAIFNTAGTTYFDTYSGPIQIRGNSYAQIANFSTTTVTLSVPEKLATYTIAGLPTCNSTLLGSTAVVSNGTAYATGTYGSAVSATGIVTRSVICTNTAGATTYAWAYN